MVNAIELRGSANESYLNKYGDVLSVLSNVKHINIFLGENNSGKSRFVRNLANSKEAIVLNGESVSKESGTIKNLRLRLRSLALKIKEIDSSAELLCNEDKMTATELYVEYAMLFDHLKISQRTFHYPNQSISGEVKNTMNNFYQIVCKTPPERRNSLLSASPRFYIPILRGIESFDMYFDNQRNTQLDSIQMNANQRDALNAYKANAGKIYKNKVCRVYGMDEKIVFTGENLYEEIRDKLLGEEKERVFIRDFEKFISASFYNGEGFTIIPLINKGYLNVKIGNSEERPLHDLGDGIKQLICILYKVFEYRGVEAFFFIEEPEMCLHPGYQRKLIDILQQDEFEKACFFITTHSNHFVDSCFNYDNVSLYKFINVENRNNVFQVINTTPRDIELLNLLGVNNTSVFMSNSTIWVEGISDKIYISKYLQVYMKHKEEACYQEGVDYSFVEYGGNNIAHWSFIDDEDTGLIKASGITNRAFLIVDNDNDSTNKKNRKERLSAVFGECYFELAVREIENTIKREVLEKTLFDGEPTYREGMQSARDRYDTKSAWIWDYIDKHYAIEKKYWNPQSKQPKTSKADFAKKICANVKTIEDLSENAIELCDKIYSFIRKTHESINGDSS